MYYSCCLTLEYVTKRLSPMGTVVGDGNRFANIPTYIMNWDPTC